MPLTERHAFFSLRPSHLSKPFRLAVTAIAIALFVWAILFTGRLGLARILATYGIAARNFLAANEAVRLSSSDTETHYARAALLNGAGFGAEAADELEKAIEARPRDYVLWIELGITREELGDADGSVAALNEAVRLAPYYAMPRWQRGNVLLRMHRYDEAFEDLKLAARSNPAFVPNLIDLAWAFSQGDPAVAQGLADVDTPAMHSAFALYLARRGKANAAVEQYKLAGSISSDKKRELVSALLGNGAFAEAYEVWRDDRGPTPGEIYDGSFEQPLAVDDSGFGWHVSPNIQGAQLSIDTQGPKDGAKALRIEFTGESTPQTSLLSQLILVQPNTSYQLTFVMRNEKLVTGGLPVVVVSDAGNRKSLGQSAGFANEVPDWQQQAVSFTSAADTKAVTLSLQREGCSTAPCPAFGTIWLDQFSLQRGR